MKKLTAIALICLLFFNWYGYRIAIHYFETSIDATLQARLDQHQYNDNELIELRIPLSLPYFTDWDDFELFEGETTINGQHYRYVKRKLVNGELILLCVPNETKTQLKKAGEEFFKQLADVQQIPGKKSASKENPVKVLSADTYMQENLLHSFHFNSSLFTPAQSPHLPSQTVAPPTQPPDC